MKYPMHLTLLAGLTATLVFSSPAIAAPPEGASEEQVAGNAKAKRLGEQLFRHDQAAWHASDVLFAQIKAEDFPELRSYLSEELDNGNIGLVFYSESDSKFFEFARYEMDGGKLISGGRHEDPAKHPLSEGLLRQLAARTTALDEGVRLKLAMCSSAAANVVSLPPDEADQIGVYILSSPVVPGRFPLGGHYRFTIGADGKPVSGRSFENSCLDAPRMERYVHNAPENFPFVHVLDSHPTEIHHYAARSMNLALQVTAAEVTWDIDYVEWSDEEIAAGEAMAKGRMPAKP
jgi:hypothetical protein